VSERPYEEFKREVLDQGSEDICGLYEAWWTANAWYPDRPLSERLAYAERAIAELTDAGLIEICEGTYHHASKHPISRAERDRVLKEYATWAIPGGVTRWYYTTEAGEMELRRVFGTEP
jgi:hypothetical protein